MGFDFRDFLQKMVGGITDPLDLFGGQKGQAPDLSFYQDWGQYPTEAVEKGINYFDVAPRYGDAEIKLGPALKPYRDKVLLACKTWKRDRKAAEEELHRSLKRLQTDHFDVYQLH